MKVTSGLRWLALCGAPAATRDISGCVVDKLLNPVPGKVALFDGRTLNGWKGSPGWWSVVDGAIRGKGTSNGLLVTDGDYSEPRLFLRGRNMNGGSHMGIRFWGRRDPDYKYGECTLVMPHDGGQWDYHSGEGGVPHQSPPPKASGSQVPDQSRFYFTELLVSRARRTIQMQSNGVWMVNLRNKEGLTLWHGPVGLQIHDGTIELEHKDIFVEPDPKEPEKLLYLKRPARPRSTSPAGRPRSRGAGGCS